MVAHHLSRFFQWSNNRSLKRPMRALLAWELGAGFTHSQNLFGVACHLRSIGVECIIATADPRFDSWFRSIGCKTLQTYLWPVMRQGLALPAQRKAQVYTDILANFGICQPVNIMANLAHYETLFDLVQPDLLLCDNAPGAVLAARERIPTIIFGSTLMMMPPQQGDAFAPIDPAFPDPAWPINDILDSFNAGLGAFAKSPLFGVKDLFGQSVVMPFGPAAFDPYWHARQEPVLSPYCPDLPEATSDRIGDKVFVYIHETMQFNKAVFDAVSSLPTGSRIYIPSLSAEKQKRLQARGMSIETTMLALQDIARDAGILIHHGGVTLTAAALALAVPQVILAQYLENEIAGRFVAHKGLGSVHSVKNLAHKDIPGDVTSMLGNKKLKQKAVQDAAEFRDWFAIDPTYEVARKAAEMLGLEPPKPLPSVDHRQWSPF
jgi:hypothetical protein